LSDLARTPDRRLLGIIEALFAVVVWGGSFVATKVALANAAPMTVVWLRFGIGVILLGVAVTLRRQWRLPGWTDLGYFALLGFIGIAFHQWLQATGLVTARATTTAWIVATIPVFMAILGWLVLHEKLTRRQILGIILAGVGVLVIISKGDVRQIFAGNFGTPGDFLILLSAPNWAIFSALSRRGLAEFPATLMMFFVMLFGWIFTSLLFLWQPGFSAIRVIPPQSWGGILFLGVFASGLAYVAWYDALQTLPVVQAGAFVYLEPFVTVLVAAWVLGESFGVPELFGALTILGGVWLVNRN
jgi:drug/metabolite transporter (DMT)-like permease